MRGLALVLLSSLACNAVAETLIDAGELVKLKGAGQWPVVDVRDLSERSRSPIPDALEESAELKLSGPILLVASSDDEVQMSAVALESRFPDAEVYAVLGGIETLKAIRQDLLQTLGDENMPSTYNIPSDTCQPGEPLFTFTKDK